MSCVQKVATVQFEPTMFEKERNVARLLELCESAALAGARLIVTPEMGTTGYCWFDRTEVAPFIETVPGPTTERFAGLARKHDCHIVVGLPEVDGDGIYFNCAVLIGPDGVVGRHRKTHPYISEPKWAAPGDLDHQVFDTSVGRIALLICMDIHFIETAHRDGAARGIGRRQHHLPHLELARRAHARALLDQSRLRERLLSHREQPLGARTHRTVQRRQLRDRAGWRRNGGDRR